MTFTDLPDLASRALGGGVIDANDEFFAARDNLVNPEPSQFETWTYGPKGKVYDGWETRRRRTPGHDWAVVRLGAPGIVRGVVVDTAHFTGNYPPFVSVEGCAVDGHPDPSELGEWAELVPKSAVRGDTRTAFEVTHPARVTHVRLNIFPDGGVARLRVHGTVAPDPALLYGLTADLAAMELGAAVVDCSDMFYGSPGNLLLPDRARQMSEGWETARRRREGNEWVLIRLAAPGRVVLAELDTTHFKGNAPGAASLRATPDDPASPSAAWFDLLPHTRLQPDTRHRFRLDSPAEAAYVRLDIYPDGGMSRLRLFGEATPPTRG
ncbi:MAG TPA: allantoicase [Dactylosporangium sp.]|nr:allantoicase [Dactylosporangium sp.]